MPTLIEKPVQAGFTLIELMIVLAIAVLLLSIVTPNFSSVLSRFKLDSATRDIASGLRQSRAKAIVSGEASLFELDLKAGTYKASGLSLRGHLPKEITLGLYTTSSNVVDETTGSIRFFSDGSSTGGRITLTLGLMKRQVDINWLTGEIRVIRDS